MFIRGLILLFSCLGLCILGCSKNPGPDETPHIILITLDTLRAQNLKCYGYDRDTSPELDALAEGATLYSRAFAASSWTLSTHASMFTGLNPVEHGAHTYKLDDRNYKVHPLDDEFVTLAEVLLDKGYQTVGFTTNTGFLKTLWNLDQGFEIYHNRRMHAKQLHDEYVFPWLEDWTGRGMHEKKPLFLFLNYMDTHEPYNTTPKAGFMDDMPNRDSKEVLELVREPVMMMHDPPPTEMLNLLIDQYDLSIANVDEQVGRLIAKLKELGIYENSIFIVTSDHGEYFGEHSLITHWKELYQEAIWVPLIIRKPGQTEGRKDETVITHVDFPGMILRELPEEYFGEAVEQFPLVPGNHPVMAEIHYIESKIMRNRPWRSRLDKEHIALIEWPLKYIMASDGEHELYNLASDWGELDNLLETQSSEASRLSSALTKYYEGLVPFEPKKFDLPEPTDEELEELRKLGYLGGPAGDDDSEEHSHD